jgi:hypothetical protein
VGIEAVKAYGSTCRIGIGDGTGSSVSATPLCRFKGADTSAGEVKSLNGYSDAAEISDWSVKAFRWAVDAGLINGVGEQRLCPKTEAPRAQVASMLMRYDAMD